MEHTHEAYKVVTCPDGHLQGTCWVCGQDFDFVESLRQAHPVDEPVLV